MVVSALVHRADPSFHVAEHDAFAFPRSQYVLFHAVARRSRSSSATPSPRDGSLLAGVGVAYPFSLRALLGALVRPPCRVVFVALPARAEHGMCRYVAGLWAALRRHRFLAVREDGGAALAGVERA